MVSAYGAWTELDAARMTARPGEEATVFTLEKDVQLRDYPIANAEKSRKLKAGDRLQVLDHKSAGGWTWWFVESSGGAQGWLRATDARSRLSTSIINGEFIAVQDDTVFVLTPAALISVPRKEIVRARLYTFDPQVGGFAMWAFFGALSTLSHGYFLALSLPSWVIVGAASASAESHAPLEEYPTKSWDQLRVFARFPQGLPPGINRGSITYPSPEN